MDASAGPKRPVLRPSVRLIGRIQVSDNLNACPARIQHRKSPYSDGLIFHRLDDGYSLSDCSFVILANAFREAHIDGEAGRQWYCICGIRIDGDLLLGLSCRGQDHLSSMLHCYIEAQYTFIKGAARWHIQRTNVWYGTNDVHRVSLCRRLRAVGSEASLNGRIGLAGSAGSLPHDSFEIFIGRHGHASRSRDKDPQRPRPRAGCLKSGDRRGSAPLCLHECDPAGADQRRSSASSRNK
jgi:hypothetical protein